jgi:hypothetical protein
MSDLITAAREALAAYDRIQDWGTTNAPANMARIGVASALRDLVAAEEGRIAVIRISARPEATGRALDWRDLRAVLGNIAREIEPSAEPIAARQFVSEYVDMVAAFTITPPPVRLPDKIGAVIIGQYGASARPYVLTPNGWVNPGGFATTDDDMRAVLDLGGLVVFEGVAL